MYWRTLSGSAFVSSTVGDVVDVVVRSIAKPP
jgi:hypothetical protein